MGGVPVLQRSSQTQLLAATGGDSNSTKFWSRAFHRIRQGRNARLASILAMGLRMMDTSRALETSTSVGLTGELEVGEPDLYKPRCTVEDLLPLSSLHKSLQWTEENVTKPPYDCTCAAMKAR